MKNKIRNLNYIILKIYISYSFKYITWKLSKIKDIYFLNELKNIWINKLKQIK